MRQSKFFNRIEAGERLLFCSPCAKPDLLFEKSALTSLFPIISRRKDRSLLIRIAFSAPCRTPVGLAGASGTHSVRDNPDLLNCGGSHRYHQGASLKVPLVAGGND